MRPLTVQFPLVLCHPTLLGLNTHLTPSEITKSPSVPCYLVALTPLNEAQVRERNLEIVLENAHLHNHEMKGRLG